MKKMMKMKWSTVVTVALGVAGFGICNSVQAAPQVKTESFIVTAPTSPNNVQAMQNIMNYMEKGWNMGLIAYNDPTNPAALNHPPIWRVCQMCFGPSTYYMWDGTNNPTGSLINENGNRLAWGFDVTDTNLFKVSDGTFTNASTDTANTMGYGGNLATNTATGLPNYFGSTLRGQVWSGTNLIADYHNGESISLPVTRVFGVIRTGYYCTDTDALAAALNYFRGVMELSDSFAINFPGGGATNQLDSRVHLDIYESDIDLDGGPFNHHHHPVGTAGVHIEGQRHLGLYYGLNRKFNLDKGTPWTLIASNLNEGVYIDSPVTPTNAFYQAAESGTPWTSSASPQPLVMSKMIQVIHPKVVVANGSE